MTILIGSNCAKKLTNQSFPFTSVLASHFACLKSAPFWKIKFVNITAMHRSTKARKCTETTPGDSKHPDEPSNCIICLEKVVCRGKLSVCNHWFCFPCILEWSEVFWIDLDVNSIISVDFWLIGFMDKWKSIIKALTNAKYVFISEYKYLPNMQDPISLHNKGICYRT